MNYKLYNIRKGIFLLEVEGNNELALTFLRAQEFYESSNDNFRGNSFSLEEYKNWYKTQSKDGTFSYGDDWKGFNIPSNIIKSCYEKNTERLNSDLFFLEICKKCEALATKSGLSSYYLIGVRKGDTNTLDHEIAHGLYYTNKTYKSEMENLLNKIKPETKTYLKNYLTELGYGEVVHDDEIQAYLATGLRQDMDKEVLEQYKKEFQLVFKEYNNYW